MTEQKTATRTTQPPLEQKPRTAAPLAKSDPATQLKMFLLANKERIKEVAAKHLDPDRVVRLTAMLVHRDKSGNLARCTPLSILNAVMEAVRLGLEPGGALGHAYLVPYWNKDISQYEAQFQAGYRGLIELAMRSEKVASVQAHVVYKKDRFDYELGDTPLIKHKPSLDDDRGPWTHAYSVIRIRGEVWHDTDGNPLREMGGGLLIDVMTKREVLKIRDRSPAAKSGMSPWKDFETEMARKTVARRNLKYAPMSEQLAEALDHENEIEGEILSREETPIEEPKGVAGMKKLVQGEIVPDTAPEQPPSPEEPEGASTPEEQQAFDAGFPGKK